MALIESLWLNCKVNSYNDATLKDIRNRMQPCYCVLPIAPPCQAQTAISKVKELALIEGEKDFFAKMVVDAVIAIGNDDRLNMIGINKFVLDHMMKSGMFDHYVFFTDGIGIVVNLRASSM
ncbi:TCP-1-eta subunit [Artemisia annua]|uniref:TCP-1-eta subunit n=1 Tax=Artemisia annua TaxID=35608 RepID=A0A2U1PQQ4_ARTAN|nr:TCP-1-eta subunit [Artemisia annua]